MKHYIGDTMELYILEWVKIKGRLKYTRIVRKESDLRRVKTFLHCL